MTKLLDKKKIAVMLETEYIPFEMNYYKEYFTSLGAEVSYVSYLWGEDKKIFVCDIDSPEKPVETMEVSIDVTKIKPSDFDAVLMGANYCAVRLREIPPMGSFGSIKELGTAPAVQFFAKAMKNKKIVKGALCHALWILTPVPKLLKGRKVTCHTVVLADIHNAGAKYVPSYVCIDDDLVTGRSAANVKEYCEAITQTIISKQKKA